MAAGCHQRSDAPTCSPSAARDVTTGDVVPGMVGCVVDRARRLKRPRSGSRSTPRRSARGATGSSPTVSTVSTTVPAELARHRTRQPPRWRGEWSHLRRRHQEALPASARGWPNGSADGRHDRPLHPAASAVRAPTWRSVLMSRTGVVSPRSTPPVVDEPSRHRTARPNVSTESRGRSSSRPRQIGMSSLVWVVGGVTTGERPLGVEQSFRTLAPSGEPWTRHRAFGAPSRRCRAQPAAPTYLSLRRAPVGSGWGHSVAVCCVVSVGLWREAMTVFVRQARERDRA